MEQLKKVISLNQAARISGYTQDYLGYLLRKGEMKGKKIGNSWFTTEAEIKNYIFKQKIRRKDYAVREFFSPFRAKRIVFAAVIIFIGCFSIWLRFFNTPHVLSADVKTSITETGENIAEITKLNPQNSSNNFASVKK